MRLPTSSSTFDAAVSMPRHCGTMFRNRTVFAGPIDMRSRRNSPQRWAYWMESSRSPQESEEGGGPSVGRTQRLFACSAERNSTASSASSSTLTWGTAPQDERTVPVVRRCRHDIGRSAPLPDPPRQRIGRTPRCLQPLAVGANSVIRAIAALDTRTVRSLASGRVLNLGQVAESTGTFEQSGLDSRRIKDRLHAVEDVQSLDATSALAMPAWQPWSHTL